MTSSGGGFSISSVRSSCRGHRPTASLSMTYFRTSSSAESAEKGSIAMQKVSHMKLDAFSNDLRPRSGPTIGSRRSTS